MSAFLKTVVNGVNQRSKEEKLTEH